MRSSFRLSDDEIASVVERAHEITELESRLKRDESELEQYVKVAEEMGVPREAMQQALNERFAFLDEKLEAGQIVFAKSGDKHYYPAKVKASDDGGVEVRFLSGGEATVGRHELQKTSLTPGARFDYYSPMNMMYTRGRVARYDSESLTVTFNTWGIEETVPLAKVRLRQETNSSSFNFTSWMLAGVSLLAGGAIASVITWLVMR